MNGVNNNNNDDELPKEWDTDVEDEKLKSYTSFQQESNSNNNDPEQQPLIITTEEDANDYAVKVYELSKIFPRWGMDCCKSPKDFKAVSNLSITVRKGEIFCLLGHNGNVRNYIYFFHCLYPINISTN